MAGLKTIYIYTEDIYPGMKYMRDDQDRLDLIGQILHTGYGIKIHKHSQTPAHQNTVISPFTESIRGRANNTPLTMQILRNAGSMTGMQQLKAANDLLEEYDIYLEKAEWE